jgi:SAM-dependent methyltransferase
MTSGAEISAGEIARLAGVGRAAVSNWRRRFTDFPRPSGGTSASPTFRLADVERWLVANNRMPTHSNPEQLWLAVQRSTVDPDRELPRLIATLLTGRPVDLHRDVQRAVTEMGVEAALTALVDRFVDLRGRRGVGNRSTTTKAVADLIADLARPEGGSVLDPSCGTGMLLSAAAARGAAAVYGQDADPDNTVVARARLAGTPEAAVRRGDMVDDAWPDLRVDAVVSDLPAGGTWPYDELAADPRWQYALPPRSEPELAWVQHALARLQPGGRAVLLLPPGVAERPAGRRIRRELLRRGALRAVIALPSGATAPFNLRLHIWVLLRPEPKGRSQDVLMVDADGEWDDARATICDATTAHLARQPLPSTLSGRATLVEAMALSGESVDLTPSRHVVAHGHGPSADAVADARATLVEALRALPDAVPVVQTRAEPLPDLDTTVGDLAKSGLLTVHSDPAMPVRIGDVLVAAVGPDPEIAVVPPGDPRTLLGPQTILIRPEPDFLDPWFVAGFLGLTANLRRITSMGSIPRVDVRKAQLPRMSMDRQRVYGDQVRSLHAFDEALQAAAAAGRALTKMIAAGLAAGTLDGER